MTSRPSTAAPILVMLAIAVPLLLLGLYVGGTFGEESFGYRMVFCMNHEEMT